jgi:hypothetical protein
VPSVLGLIQKLLRSRHSPRSIMPARGQTG